MQLHNALDQIDAIRRGLARAELFRGYRALPTALTGVIALGAALAQGLWIEDPVRQVAAWSALWIGAAVLAFATVTGPLMLRLLSRPDEWRRSHTLVALEHLLPSYVAGALLTAVILRSSPESIAILPGLWQVLFALGLFASRSLLPLPVLFMALFYLVAGTATWAWGLSGGSLSPWMMGLPFGVGQLGCAAILRACLERDDATS